MLKEFQKSRTANTLAAAISPICRFLHRRTTAHRNTGQMDHPAGGA